MKISLKGVANIGNKEIVTAGGDELVTKIGSQLGEVEEVINLGAKYEGIVVAKIVKCEDHNDSDHLYVCKVDDGGADKSVKRDKDGYVQVVCGAPNCQTGLTVAWIPPGATVPSSHGGKEEFVLEAREIRGQVSNGMLASASELAISDDHDGILVIEEAAKPGTPFKNLYLLDDTIIDVENKMFTHRPDCFGLLGVARELAGIQGLPFKSPDWYLKPTAVKPVTDARIKGLKVTNDIPKLCTRYMAVAVSGIKVGKSPIWLQSVLSRNGIRPINNIVDMTNYMMILTGQPLHAFDYDKVANKEGKVHITVRQPHKGEKLTLLDGKTITPRDDAILIANGDDAIALGGVMGGGNSEIDQNTTRIIIECATFDMYNIRRTSMEHGLFSEAVTRFTKGQSPWQNPAVLAKAVEMTQQVNPGAQPATTVVDEKGNLSKNPAVNVTAKFINDRLGTELTAAAMAVLLKNVEFDVSHTATELTVTAPFWRTDIEIKEDVVEEVGRLYGYDHLPQALPVKTLAPASRNADLEFKRRIRSILAKAGANELLTYSFVHGKLLTNTGQDPKQAFQLSNALSPDLQYYRMSLMPSLLDKIHGNIKAGYDHFALFEMNKAHNKLHAKDAPGDKGLPSEFNMLGLVFAANDKAAAKYDGAPFYQARHYLDYLASQLGLPLTYTPIAKNFDFPVMQPYDQSRSALVSVTGTEIVLGSVGELRAQVRSALKLPAFSAGFEVGLNELQEALATHAGGYTPLGRYPKTSQDISFKVAADVLYADVAGVANTVLEAAGEKSGYIFAVEPLDIYQPKEGKVKHIALRVIVSHPERTLVNAEVNTLLDELAQAAKTKLKAERL